MIKIIIIILLITIIHCYYNTIMLNILVFLTIQRGILIQNCTWYKINDWLLTDKTGVGIIKNLKKEGDIVTTNIVGTNINIINNINYVDQLLQKSPFVFGVGKFKFNFFQTFMKYNVGVSEGKAWIRRRIYNDKILQPNNKHPYLETIQNSIRYQLKDKVPVNFEEFTKFSKKLTSKIVFGTYNVYEPVFQVFEHSNNMMSLYNLKGKDKELFEKYHKYLSYHIDHPNPGSLIYLSSTFHKGVSKEEIIHQIPHWIFPINGVFSTHFPRLLVMLINHPEKLDKVVQDIKNNKIIGHKENYLRKCILELFRLNNPVNSTFRTLLQDYSFDGKKTYKKGEQFVFFNNPLLRIEFQDNKPDQFVPERWTQEMETSKKALMFNQGNQSCPGKEVTISIMEIMTIEYFKMMGFNIKTNVKLDRNNIDTLINPCDIRFYR